MYRIKREMGEKNEERWKLRIRNLQKYVFNLFVHKIN